MRQVLAFVIVAALLARASASAVPAGVQAVAGSDGWELPLLSFGAKCDGQTDDAAAIQRAFDAARRISATVVWPAKICAIATGVTLGGELYHPDDPVGLARDLDDRAFGLDHIERKLLRLPETMTTESGREEARRRAAFVLQYRDEFLRELGGG